MAMIHDVDESLRALVKRDALNGSKVEVAFDAPTKDWVAKRNAPTIDMYLYDIREDTTRRETAWIEIRDEKGIVTERRLPPRRYRLSYLVTAWTNRPEDEHRLLSGLLSCFVRHEYMPLELLTGVLEDSSLPVIINVALPVPADRNIADVWSAMGGELKPSLDLIVTAPLDIERSLEVGPPVQEVTFLELVKAEPGTIGKGKNGKGPSRALATADADITATGGLAGSELDGEAAGATGTAGGGAGAAGAGAAGADAAASAAATSGGKQGKGVARLPSGSSGSAGAAGGAGSSGSSGSSAGSNAAGEPGSSSLADETFYGSAPGKPGRRIRVRQLPRRRP
jgi:uncharacterized protein DUF4255